ncbi:ATP-binding protein [Dyella sp. C11]|uniref:hybrid sensor histidine kinase/response regulator n=1 Tax=Dyella sp. C11 TaxID=2126991 RepID=UPI000D65CA8C|nr:ATP-binding protein [Dyella sp. C11]
MLSGFSRWLRTAPVSDPVERRNASFVQMLFLFLGVALPLNKLYVVLNSTGYQHLMGEHGLKVAILVDLLTDLAMALAAWCGLLLIRQGRFHAAIIQFLTVVLVSALLAYVTFGYWAVFGDLIPIMAIALGGLMLSRRALWLIYGTVMLEFIAGMTADLLRQGAALQATQHGGALPNAFVDLPSRAFGYLLIVLILDRATNALRESLGEANQHRKQLQEEMLMRELAQEQLVQSRKMDAIGKLASGIAHDFNNILGIILGFARERYRINGPAIAHLEDAQVMAHALGGVDTAARRGAAITRKLLNFARHDPAHRETFDLGESLRDLMPMLKQLLPAPFVIRLELANAPLPIRFDRSQFELALLNMASNARDAMPDGGQLTIGTRLEDDGHASLLIEDTGEGMSPSVRQRIFEPFFTTKPSARGTGLGLSVVYALIEDAGGAIHVDSTLGAGTRFDVRLPLALVPDDTAIADKTINTDPAASPLRILLVDDDEELRELLAQALRQEGWHVDAAGSAAAALRLAAGEPPHVLICDNRMPDMDGTELLAKLRPRWPRVPTILISAYLEIPDEPSEPWIMRMPKPFSPDDLLARIRELVKRCKTAAELQGVTIT